MEIEAIIGEKQKIEQEELLMNLKQDIEDKNELLKITVDTTIDIFDSAT